MKAIQRCGFRRQARFVAAGIGVVAALLAPATVSARVTLVSPTTAGITLTPGTDGSLTAECNYGSLLGDQAGNLVFTCSGSPVAPEAGALSINPAGAATGIPVGTGSTTFSVVRTGGITGAVSGTLQVTAGNCAVSPTTVNFASGSATPATATISANTALANTSCTVTLSTTTANLGTPSTLSVNVTPQSPGTLALNLSGTASSLAASTGSTTFSVTRSNGNSGIVGASLGVSGGCTVSSPSVSFADGSTTPNPATITLAAGTAAGGASCTVTLSSPTGGASTGSPASHVVSITSSGPPPPPPGCTTNATRTVAWTTGITSLYEGLKAGESLAISINLAAFPLQARTDYNMQVVEGGGLSGGADVQFTVSNCPGDFNAGVTLGAACHKHTSALGDSIQFKNGPATFTRTPLCWLPAGTATAYFNIRPVLRPTPSPPDAPGTPSCPVGQSCSFNFALSR